MDFFDFLSVFWSGESGLAHGESSLARAGLASSVLAALILFIVGVMSNPKFFCPTGNVTTECITSFVPMALFLGVPVLFMGAVGGVAGGRLGRGFGAKSRIICAVIGGPIVSLLTLTCCIWVLARPTGGP